MSLTTTQTHSLLFAVLGLAVVLVTSLVKTINLTPKQSHFISVVLSIATGAVSSYFQKNGSADLVSIAKNSTTIYAASQLIYGFALQNTSVDAWLTKFNLLPAKN
jgi:hypothetical protein